VDAAMATQGPPAARIAAVSHSEVGRLSDLAVKGLALMCLPEEHSFVQTLRGVPGPQGPRVVTEGSNLRYAAISALGLEQVAETEQRTVLGGPSAAEFTSHLARQARRHRDPGAVALTAWAAAEVADHFDPVLFQRMRKWLTDPAPLPTVDVSWMLTAALAARHLGDTEAIVDASSRRLLAAQGARGIFPHALPAASLGRWRAHVGCFADQVYPIQALARLAAAVGAPDALDAANRCAARICELQGPAGQWWWHYDVRDGSVVEGYPVYSVHQHAMAPMALFDLLECGGDDHRRSIALGLQWLQTHPEVFGSLVDEQASVVWRKVGRREPAKAARKISAVTTSLHPGWHVPGVDSAMPPTEIDHECRPYELGWLLYAWHSPQRTPHAGESAGVEAARPLSRQEQLFGLPLDAMTLPEVVQRCTAAIEQHRPLQIGVLNAAKMVKLRHDELLRESLLGCELLLADGQSVVWASRLLGHPLPERVAGIDLFEELLRLADREGHSVYLLGAQQHVLSSLERTIAVRFPGARLAGSRDGYFSDDEADAVAEEIRLSGADMLFLGMTSPKKELFISRYGPTLGVPVVHGVGGSFDVMAGVTQRAPLAWQRAGLEWAYRLKQEPRRLARRYVTTNTAFVAMTLHERFRPTLPYAAAGAQLRSAL
jgi:exopolysaccharide biosynthesis WecB/TagA/CpsF family protein